MIIVTGAAGFIGSNVVADLQAPGRDPIVVCDWFGEGDKWRNLAKRNVAAFVAPGNILAFLNSHASEIRCVIHMGAISATTETDIDRLIALNIQSTVSLWDWCAEHAVPFIYASSAAVYGDREQNFRDDDSPDGIASLRPLNAYGWSKKVVDEIFSNRVANHMKSPPQWVGLRFFNVYGPNEYHKGPMRSVAVKVFEAVTAGEPVRLFKSNRDNISHGNQQRDFIYVKDCTRVISWFLDHRDVSGIFNLGTGRQRSFLEMIHALERATNRGIEVEFIDMPENLKAKYQYFTQADMTKIQARGLPFSFTSLEEGIADYVTQYLSREDRFR